MTREDILSELRRAMEDLFDLEPAAVHPAARLYEDLDLDSIDAVDMAVKMQEITGQRVDEQTLRRIRTVGDVIDAIERVLQAPR